MPMTVAINNAIQ